MPGRALRPVAGCGSWAVRFGRGWVPAGAAFGRRTPRLLTSRGKGEATGPAADGLHREG